MSLFKNGLARRDMRAFVDLLEKKGQLKRISELVDPDLELDEIRDRG